VPSYRVQRRLSPANYAVRLTLKVALISRITGSGWQRLGCRNGTLAFWAPILNSMYHILHEETAIQTFQQVVIATGTHILASTSTSTKWVWFCTLKQFYGSFVFGRMRGFVKLDQKSPGGATKANAATNAYKRRTHEVCCTAVILPGARKLSFPAWCCWRLQVDYVSDQHLLGVMQ